MADRDWFGRGRAGWSLARRLFVLQVVVVAVVVLAGAALAYYDSLRAQRLPAALVQAQRDLFGAHTYRRTDRDGVFHTRWDTDRHEESAD